MKRVLVYVEGQTEETFVRELLMPYFLERDMYLIPTLAVTKRVVSGPNYKGGVCSYQQIKRDLLRLLKDTGASAITTMLDLYGLPDDFPGKTAGIRGGIYERISHVESSFRNDINHNRFIPYLALHEFEAMLFARPVAVAGIMSKPQTIHQLEEICSAFETPEHINDDPSNAPSKRIERIFPEYRKSLHGILIALEIGLDVIRESCTHFHQWLLRLEQV